MADKVTVCCKHCGGREIVAADVVMVTANIGGWTRQADGTLEPAFQGGSDVDWDSQAPRNADMPYACVNCDRLLGVGDLVVEEAREGEDGDDE